MSLNLKPFVYSYKLYPNCKLATMVNQFCSAMQRLFFVFGLMITLVVLVDSVSNWGTALGGAAAFFVLWLVLKLNKDKWSDKIAAKQEGIDNPKIEE